MARADISSLLQPLTLAGVTIPNRVMTSAMTVQYGEDGLISDRHLAYYRERAHGGIGLQFSEQLTASPLSGSPFGSAIHAYDGRQIDRFRALAEALEPYPSRFFAQLFGGGVANSSSAGLDDWQPVRGPSRVAMPGGEQPLPLTREEIAAIAADFASSAAAVKAGGLDGVEVHGSHGWLVGEFLSPFYNRREDEYGGSVANRCRFALEIGAAIRAEVGEEFPLGLSLTYDEMLGAAGITPDDTLAQIEVLLSAGLFDFFDLSVGSSHVEHHTIAPMAVEEGFALDFAARAKSLVGERAAIFVAGRIVDPAMAADAVSGGATDMVAMSRAHLADPHLVRKLSAGRAEDLTRCVGSNVCVARALLGEPVACVLTPATGREVAGWPHGEYERVEPAAAKRVLVAGAGPGGLRAAATAAARGHAVTVYERDERAGGHLAGIAWLPTREGWARAIDDLLGSLRRHGGELRLGTAVDRELVEREQPDVVVIATGSVWDASGASVNRPQRAGIPGADGAAIGLDVALARAAADPAQLGERVLILDETGGTYPPLGLAEVLAAAGARVDFVTPDGEVGADAARSLELQHLMPRLRALGVELTSAHDIERIEGEAVHLSDVWGGPGRVVEGVATVVLALERIPRDGLGDELSGLGAELHVIGDALTPRSTASAIYEGERLGLAL